MGRPRRPKRQRSLTISPAMVDATNPGLIAHYRAAYYSARSTGTGMCRRAFRVHCARNKKKFAFDVCHSKMMEYLLANQDLTIEESASSCSAF